MKFPIAILAALILFTNCKSRSPVSAVKGINNDDLIILDFTDAYGRQEKLVLGYVTPERSVFYFKEALSKYTRMVDNELLSARASTSLFEQMRIDAEPSIDDKIIKDDERFREEELGLPPQSRKTDWPSVQSAKIAENLSRSPFRTSYFPSGLIPPALWDQGIGFEYFIFPMKEFSPEEIRRKYEASTETERLELSVQFRLYSRDKISFYRLLEMYKRTYDLEVFNIVRRSVQKDIYYQKASASFFSSASFLAGAVMSIVWWGHFYQFTLRYFDSMRTATTVTSLGSVIFVGLANYRSELARRARLTDPKYAKLIRSRQAKEVLGFDGVSYQQSNDRNFDKILEQKVSFPELVGFLKHPLVEQYLRDPANYYVHEKMLDSVLQTSRSDIERCKKSDSSLVDEILSEITATNADAGVGPSAIVGEFDDPIRLRKVFDAGSKSALFCELFFIARSRSSTFRIGFENREQGSLLGRHGSPGHVTLFSTSEIKEGEQADFWAATLAHELWHQFKQDDRVSEIFSYPNLREYALSHAAEETLGMMVAMRIKEVLKPEKFSFVSGAKNYLSRMITYMTGVETDLEINPDALRKSDDFLKLVMSEQIYLWNELR